MSDVGEAFATAFGLIVGGDPGFWGVLLMSLRVTLSAIVIAAVVGLPLGVVEPRVKLVLRKAIALERVANLAIPPRPLG